MKCRFCDDPTDYMGPCRHCGGSYNGPSEDTPEGEAIDYWFKETMRLRHVIRAIKGPWAS